MRTRNGVIRIGGMLALIVSGFAQEQVSRCPVLQEPVKSTLANRVRTRYQADSSATVQLIDDSLVAGGCYHRLIFEVQSGPHSFTLPLYLSPDQRYLTRDLTEVRPLAASATGNAAALSQPGASCPNPAGSSAPVPALTLVPPATLTDGAGTAVGPATAPVTLVVFSDFQCPYCKRAAEWLKAETAKFDPKDLRLVYRYFPLSFHAWAKPAAEAAACVAAQSPATFWKFHDAIFTNQASINPENAQGRLMDLALATPGINAVEFQKCVESGRMAETVKKDQSLGASIQVRGTPTVFINGKLLPGLRSPEQLHAAIEEAASAGKTLRTAVVRRQEDK